MQLQHHAGFGGLGLALPFRDFLGLVGVAERAQEQAVGAHRGFDHEGHVVAVGFAGGGVNISVEVLLLFAAQGLVLGQVEVGARSGCPQFP